MAPTATGRTTSLLGDYQVQTGQALVQVAGLSLRHAVAALRALDVALDTDAGCRGGPLLGL